MKKIFLLFSSFFLIFYANAQVTVCLTGKIEETLPVYKALFVNAVDLALRENKVSRSFRIKEYFYDNKPLSPVSSYFSMLNDGCSAIIGYGYLSDLLLVEKEQKNMDIPIFSTYSSSLDSDKIADNVFIFNPTYNFQAKMMMNFLVKKFPSINNVLLVTESNRNSLLDYKFVYEKLLNEMKIKYDNFDFTEYDNNIESRLHEFINEKAKKYNYVFLFSGAVNSAKIINAINDKHIVFIGTENFGNSMNNSLYVLLKNKTVKAFSIRNIDFLKSDSSMKKFMESYKSQYNSLPNPLSAYAYDAMNILLGSMQATGSISLKNLFKTNFNGITGARIENKRFYRSEKYVILSVGPKGFVVLQ